VTPADADRITLAAADVLGDGRAGWLHQPDQLTITTRPPAVELRFTGPGPRDARQRVNAWAARWQARPRDTPIDGGTRVTATWQRRGVAFTAVADITGRPVNDAPPPGD
jgi:hypothetical protein